MLRAQRVINALSVIAALGVLCFPSWRCEVEAAGPSGSTSVRYRLGFGPIWSPPQPSRQIVGVVPEGGQPSIRVSPEYDATIMRLVVIATLSALTLFAERMVWAYRLKRRSKPLRSQQNSAPTS
ncbi:MAG TPA: hypothetical protein VH475_23040 [Tepidisphaeraceae bacterium]|jgi:hypothetical protein